MFRKLFARKPRPTATDKARAALGVKIKPGDTEAAHKVAYDAVERELFGSKAHEPVPEAPFTFKNGTSVPQQSHRTIDPAFHLEKARDIAANLGLEEKRLLEALKDEQARHRGAMIRLESELKGVRKTAAFYRTADQMLGDVMPEQAGITVEQVGDTTQYTFKANNFHIDAAADDHSTISDSSSDVLTITNHPDPLPALGDRIQASGKTYQVCTDRKKSAIRALINGAPLYVFEVKK